jgi:hypothetical protein
LNPPAPPVHVLVAPTPWLPTKTTKVSPGVTPIVALVIPPWEVVPGRLVEPPAAPLAAMFTWVTLSGTMKSSSPPV